MYEQVILDNAVVKIHIAKSKTDQMGKDVDVCMWMTIPAEEDVNICPLGRFVSFCWLDCHAQDSFFIHRDRSPVTKYQFEFVFKQ